MQKAMTEMNLQLHHVVSDITGATGMRIIRAIIAGERDPAVLASMRDTRCHSSAEVNDDFRVIGIAARNGMVKNGGVRGQTGDRQGLDILLQRAAGEEIAGDVIEPKTLAKIIQYSCCLHGFISLTWSRMQPRRNCSNR
jgi:hypothetical protein